MLQARLLYLTCAVPVEPVLRRALFYRWTRRFFCMTLVICLWEARISIVQISHAENRLSGYCMLSIERQDIEKIISSDATAYACKASEMLVLNIIFECQMTNKLCMSNLNILPFKLCFCRFQARPAAMYTCCWNDRKGYRIFRGEFASPVYWHWRDSSGLDTWCKSSEEYAPFRACHMKECL